MPAILNAPPHVYAARGLDRAAERRRDETWLADRRADPATRLILCTGLLVPIGGARRNPGCAAPTVAELDRPAGADAIFLGAWRDGCRLVRWRACPTPRSAARRYVELRSVGTAARRRRGRSTGLCPRPACTGTPATSYCSVCGNATVAMQGGHVRRCVDCGARPFPAHRPRRDRARHRRRALPARPLGALRQRHVLDAGRLRGARRIAGGDDLPRGAGGVRHRGRGRGLPLLPALAVPASR